MRNRLFAFPLRSLIAAFTLSLILFSLLKPAEKAGVLAAGQLLANPGFEAVADGRPKDWLSATGTLSTTTSLVRNGNSAASFESNSAFSKAYQLVPVRPGDYYTFSGYVLKNDVKVSQVVLMVFWMSSADQPPPITQYVETPPLVDNSPGYAYLSTGRVLAPPNAHVASVWILVKSTPSEPGKVNLDDFSFVEEDGPTPSATASPSTTPTSSRTPTASPSATASASPKPSPSATATPSAQPAYSSKIRLNEILASPKNVDWNGDGVSDSDDEWIELYNEGEAEASLSGWLLGDATSKRFTVPQGTVLGPHRYVVLYGSQTGLRLNNDGDSARLIRPDGVLADSVDFGALAYNVSYARDPDGHGNWRKSNTPSPGASNPSAPSTAPSRDTGGDTVSPLDQVRDRLVSVSTARSAPQGTKVIVRAQITAQPNLLGSRRMYVRDQTAGLAVYLQRGSYPPLHIGDWVLLTGVMSERRGEKEVQVYWALDAVFLEKDAPPVPVPAQVGDVGEAFESELVQVTGTVSSRSGSYVYLTDGDSSARVYVRTNTGIKIKDISPGDRLSVAGIVSQYDSSPPYDEGFRLMPRYSEDVQLLPSPIQTAAAESKPATATPEPTGRIRPTKLPNTGDNLLPWLFSAGIFSTLLGLSLRLAQKRR